MFSAAISCKRDSFSNDKKSLQRFSKLPPQFFGDQLTLGAEDVGGSIHSSALIKMPDYFSREFAYLHNPQLGLCTLIKPSSLSDRDECDHSL